MSSEDCFVITDVFTGNGVGLLMWLYLLYASRT